MTMHTYYIEDLRTHKDYVVSALDMEKAFSDLFNTNDCYINDIYLYDKYLTNPIARVNREDDEKGLLWIATFIG